MASQSSRTDRYVAFLRAINVGGHTVKMDQLRALFEEIGLENVETFIASGNVIFESAEDEATLQQQISDHLHASLGFQAEAFLRSTPQLAEIAAYQPFPEAQLSTSGTTLHVAFLPAPPASKARQAILDLRNETDDLHIHDRELYWLIRGGISDSRIGGTLLGKAVGAPMTVRNANTIRRLVAKYPPA